MGRMLTTYAVAQRHSEPESQQHSLFVPGRTKAAPCSSGRDSSLHLALTVSPAFWPGTFLEPDSSLPAAGLLPAGQPGTAVLRGASGCARQATCEHTEQGSSAGKSRASPGGAGTDSTNPLLGKKLGPETCPAALSEQPAVSPSVWSRLCEERGLSSAPC